MKIMRSSIRHILTDLLFDVMGSCLFAIGMQMFVAPNQIAPGGFSAIAVVLNYLFGIPIGTCSFLLNIPVLLLGLKFLGKTFTVKTMTTVVVMSILTNAMYYAVPPYSGDALLAALFGGAMMGAGLALVFMRDSTTGGVDILSRLIQRRVPYVPMGRLLLILDLIVIGISALVFGRLETVLYSLVCVYVSAFTVDSVLCGMERGKMVYILSPKTEQIAGRIIQELDRSGTFLQAKGAYSGEQAQALLVALRIQQYHHLKQIVHETDPNAFMIVTDSTEVLGEGFKPIEKG